MKVCPFPPENLPILVSNSNQVKSRPKVRQVSEEGINVIP